MARIKISTYVAPSLPHNPKGPFRGGPGGARGPLVGHNPPQGGGDIGADFDSCHALVGSAMAGCCTTYISILSKYIRLHTRTHIKNYIGLAGVSWPVEHRFGAVKALQGEVRVGIVQATCSSCAVQRLSLGTLAFHRPLCIYTLHALCAI